MPSDYRHQPIDRHRSRRETMPAIVQDRVRHQPEAVLRSPTSTGPRSATTRCWCGCRRQRRPGHVALMAGMPYAMRLAGFGRPRPKASNPGRASPARSRRSAPT